MHVNRILDVLSPGTMLADELIHLLWSRTKLLYNYKPTPIHSQIILFKAKQLLPEYQSIEDPFTHWQPYTEAPIIKHLIAANHETILEGCAAKLISDRMSEFILRKARIFEDEGSE